MRKIELTNIVKKVVYTFLSLITYTTFAQDRSTVNPGGGVGGVGPGAVPNTPIDMYEGALLMLAVVMMVGYYLYTRNRKAIA